jgi:hypothetical protein
MDIFMSICVQICPPSGEALVGRDVATAGLFLVRLDCFQLVGADFRLSLHLNSDVSGAENHDVASLCANLAAAPS